jgi:ABC-type transport system involved in multi-copper enzyme maturation permease subunit
MLLRMFAIENQKVTRRKMFWVEVAALAVTVLAMLGLMVAARQMLAADVSGGGNINLEGITQAQAESYLTWPTSFPFVLPGVYTVGALLAIVLAGAVTAQEYTWRSFQLWLSRGTPRWQVLAAKFAAISVALLLIVGAALLLTAVFSGAASLLLLDSLPAAAVSWPHLLLAFLGVTLSLLPYAALGLLLAVAARSTVVALGGGMAYALLLEPLLVQLMPLLGEGWANVTGYVPNALGRSLNAGMSNLIAAGGAAPAIEGLSPAMAALLLAGYAAVMLTTAVIIFQRQDLG